MVAARVHRGRRPRVRASRSCRWRPSCSAGSRGCSTSAPARARSPRVVAGSAATSVVGRRPDARTRSSRRSRGRAGRATLRAGAAALPFADARVRRRRRLPGVRAHRRRRRGHRRGRAGAAARRPVRVLPEPPAAADARQRLDRRPDPRPARAVLAHRPLPHRGRVDRGGGEGRVHPLRAPAAVAATSTRWPTTAWSSSGCWSRRRRPGFLARAPEYREAATIPRLLVLITRARRRTAPYTEPAVSEFVVITGLSGAGRSQAADILEDLGWFVIDNLPPAAHPEGGRAGAGARARASRRSPSSSAPGRTTRRSCRRSTRCAARCMRLRILFLEASTDVLVRRYETTPAPPPARRRRPRAGRARSRPSASCSSR